jgi:hypothetical protein
MVKPEPKTGTSDPFVMSDSGSKIVATIDLVKVKPFFGNGVVSAHARCGIPPRNTAAATNFIFSETLWCMSDNADVGGSVDNNTRNYS